MDLNIWNFFRKELNKNQSASVLFLIAFSISFDYINEWQAHDMQHTASGDIYIVWTDFFHFRVLFEWRIQNIRYSIWSQIEI